MAVLPLKVQLVRTGAVPELYIPPPRWAVLPVIMQFVIIQLVAADAPTTDSAVGAEPKGGGGGTGLPV